jgi:prepilin-type N-terminal cleavage/methylation domain-containing protein
MTHTGEPVAKESTMTARPSRGFTLIELLVVIAIISLLKNPVLT